MMMGYNKAFKTTTFYQCPHFPPKTKQNKKLQPFYEADFIKLTSKFYEAVPRGQAGVRSTACQAQLRCDVYHETFPIPVPFPLCFLHKQQRRGLVGGGWGGRMYMHL